MPRPPDRTESVVTPMMCLPRWGASPAELWLTGALHRRQSFLILETAEHISSFKAFKVPVDCILVDTMTVRLPMLREQQFYLREVTLRRQLKHRNRQDV